MRPPPLDLDAITARWKGYDGALTAVYSEEREAWVITAADDGSPEVDVVAEIETDEGQTVAHLWAGAGQAITALVAEAQKFRAERDALRAVIVEFVAAERNLVVTAERDTLRALAEVDPAKIRQPHRTITKDGLDAVARMHRASAVLRDAAEVPAGELVGPTIVHLVTQRDQPYGSVRRCCEVCGRVPHEPDSYTDDPAKFGAMPDGFVTCETAQRSR